MLNNGVVSFNKNNSIISNKNASLEDISNNLVSNHTINPNYGKIGTTNNCKRCTFAYELQRRGFDVKATKTLNATGQTMVSSADATMSGKQGGVTKTNLSFAKNYLFDKNVNSNKVTKFLNQDVHDIYNYKNFNYLSMIGSKGSLASKEHYESDTIFNAIASQNPNRARGELSMKYKSGGGHSMAWEIINGKTYVFDCQTGKTYDSDKFSKIVEGLSTISYTRLDNKQLDMDFLSKWVENA